jgi:hypothetical protein
MRDLRVRRLRWRLVVNSLRGGRRRDRLEQIREPCRWLPFAMLALAFGRRRHFDRRLRERRASRRGARDRIGPGHRPPCCSA